MNDAREYRVRWQREGFAPRSKLYQTRQGAERFALVIEGRMAEATGLDPGDYACCSGRECGCRGQTNAEAWAERSANVPPLVRRPVLEGREVGEWMSVSPGESA